MKALSINLDLKNNSYADIELKQGCQDTLIVTITDLGEVCDLTGQVISVEMLKADDTFIIQSTDITVLNNKVTVILNKDLTRISGKGKLQIKMTKNDIVSGSWVVTCNIRKGAIEGNIGQSGNIVTIKEELDKSIVQAKIENDKTQELITNGGAATKGELAKTNASLEDITNVKLPLKMNNGDLTSGAVAGVSGGDYSIQVFQRPLREGQADLITITMREPNAQSNKCNQMFLVSCNWYGKLTITTIVNDSNGYGCYVEQSALNTYDVKISYGQASGWTPKINIMKVIR